MMCPLAPFRTPPRGMAIAYGRQLLGVRRQAAPRLNFELGHY